MLWPAQVEPNNVARLVHEAGSVDSAKGPSLRYGCSDSPMRHCSPEGLRPINRP